MYIIANITSWGQKNFHDRFQSAVLTPLIIHRRLKQPDVLSCPRGETEPWMEKVVIQEPDWQLVELHDHMCRREKGTGGQTSPSIMWSAHHRTTLSEQWSVWGVSQRKAQRHTERQQDSELQDRAKTMQQWLAIISVFGFVFLIWICSLFCHYCVCCVDSCEKCN